MGAERGVRVLYGALPFDMPLPMVFPLSRNHRFVLALVLLDIPSRGQTVSGVLWTIAMAISCGYIRRESGDVLAACDFEVHPTPMIVPKVPLEPVLSGRVGGSSELLPSVCVCFSSLI